MVLINYLQGRNRDSDIENRLMDPVGEREGGMNRESCSEIYTLPYVKQIANGKFCVTQKAQPGAL